ncbi:DUF4097 domain-containing protein [Bacillus atrophaeus]|uniref:DUF4097 family beta strand repeat-containing protein n=1 Tax=Bacillus atrophaeus TaxID=1452 RepID=UPI002E1F0E84|nr:DUF4097 domain-containing protein [Bacillus atrophaeus]MED4814931.1 DUF4097 domain-containing protein [Bacillus atrophaeus]MED4824391.1 DUF4097 domain-containing protein [Bacillus atrophaeus]MED4843449.1 DUF4097 domain-containing protein [Bacillus atrophaeus]
MKQEKERILKLVEEGKLTAQEALTLIEKLDSEYKEKENKITSLSTDVHEADESFAANKEGQKPSIGAKLFDWIDSAVKKVKEVDLDLNFGHAFDVQHIFQFKETDFSSLELQIANGSVNIVPWDDSDVRAECHSKVFRADSQEAARDAFLQHIECEAKGSKFFIRTEKKTMKTNVTLYIPQKQYDKIRVKLFNGPIRGEHLHVKEFSAKTTNGVLSFSHLTAEKASAETANGQIKLANHSCGTIEAETINGLIDLRGRSESVDVQSFNGNIAVTVTEPDCRSIYTKTTTGNVELAIPSDVAVKAELKSNLGSLSHELLDVEMLKEKNETIQKEMMFTSNQGHDQNIAIFSESLTGAIKLKHTQR